LSGVFRDPASGEYRYYGWNDYEERRLRDWDDHYGYDSYRPYVERPAPAPPPPMQFAPIPEPAAEPVAPQPVSTLKLPTQVVFDTGAMEVLSPDFVPVVASWEGPTPQTAIAAPAAPFNFQELQRNWNASQPPAQVGQIPEFDAFFDRLTAQGQSITYQRIDNDLLVPAF
jgi:hypothetical protein